MENFLHDIKPKQEYHLNVECDNRSPEEIFIYKDRDEVGKVYKSGFFHGVSYDSYREDQTVDHLVEKSGIKVRNMMPEAKPKKDKPVSHVEYAIILFAFLVFGLTLSLF